ncbi:MAG: tetratricopeptide repeat protein [Vicinamibacterales bacterium]
MQTPRRLKTPLLYALGILVAVSGGACSRSNPSEHARRGDAFVEAKKPAEAAIEYRTALQLNPNMGEVRLKLGDLHMQSNELPQALGEYLRAADLLPNNITAQIKAGDLLLLAQRWEDAKGRAMKAIELDHANADAQVLLGNALAGLRDVDAALSGYQQALLLNPDEEVAYRNIAALQLAKGRPAEAEAAFRKAISVAPKSVKARLGLASFLWAAGRAAEAEQAFKETYALDPKDLSAARALGIYYVGSQRMAEAEPYFVQIARSERTPSASIGLADYYIVAKRFDAAKPLLKDAATDKTAYPDAMLRLAAIDVALGVRAEAEIKLRELLERHSKHMAARLLSARLLLLDGKRQEALAQAESIARDDPQAVVAADAQVLVGVLQAALDRPEDAIRSFEDALRRRPRLLDAELELARLHFVKRSFDEAERYVNDALETDPKNPFARATRIQILLAKGDVSKAKKELAILTAEFPHTTAVLHLLAAQQVAENQFGAARATYGRLLQIRDTDVDAIAGLVRLDLTTDRKQDAVTRIEAGLRTVTNRRPLYVLAAKTYMAVGDLEKAEDALRKAIELDPDRLEAYGLLGTLYAREKRLNEANANFEAIAKRNPSNVSAALMLGMIHEVRGQTAEAERRYRGVLAVDPQSPVAANNLAWLYASTGRNLNDALELAKIAHRRLPDESHVNDTLGWTYYRLGQFSQAVTHLEVSATKDPEAAMTHYHLGMAYAQSGEPLLARQSLTRALAFHTEFDGIAEARTTLASLPK